MIINKSIISIVLFLVFFRGLLYSQCSFELVSVKQKKCRIVLTLKNSSNDTVKISSNSVTYSNDGVFEPHYYTINADTLSILLNRKNKLLNFGHEFQGDVVIDGRQGTNYIYIYPEEEFRLITEKSKRQSVTNILVTFDYCRLEENL